MKILVQLERTSQPIEYEAEDVYEKGSYTCLRCGDKVFKHPTINVWRLTEPYGESPRK